MTPALTRPPREKTTLKKPSLIRFKEWRSLFLDENTVLKIIHGTYHNGYLYSGLCASCKALSSVVTNRVYLKLSEDPLVLRYMSIYNRHPPLPIYVDMLLITYKLRPWLKRMLFYSLYLEHVENRYIMYWQHHFQRK